MSLCKSPSTTPEKKDWTYEGVRSFYLEKRLENADWDKLAKKVNAFSPSTVVLLTRKMTRLAEITDFSSKLPNTRIISDFALPWCHSSIRGPVAVVDDSRCRGTTLAHVCQKLHACGISYDNMQTFVVASLLDDSVPVMERIPCHSVRTGIQPTQEDDQEQEYRNFSCLTALVPSLRAMPCELEFPVFSAPYAQEYEHSTQIYLWLYIAFGSNNVHYLTLPENRGAGLERYSVDIYPQSEYNYKIHLHLDDATRTMYLVPMAVSVAADRSDFFPELRQIAREKLKGLPQGVETFDNEALHRLDLYMSSLHFGWHHFHRFSAIMDITKCTVAEDARFLFGEDFSASLVKTLRARTVPVTDSGDYPILLHADQNELFFWHERLHKDEACMNFWNEMRAWKPVRGMCTIDAYFIRFFQELGKILGEKKLDDYKLDDRELVQKNPYLRLRIGPTFGDLLLIMNELWKNLPDAPISVEDLHNKVSQLVDKHIGYGQLVPVINQFGKRAFRKGEAPFFDRKLISALHAMGYDDIKLTTDIENYVEHMDDQAREMLQEVMNRL